MPTFHYVAKKGPQELIEGTLEAENRAGALSRLIDLGYAPLKITEGAASARETEVSAAPVATAAGTVSAATRVPAQAMNQFTRQFASLVRSQVPLLRCLRILREQTGSRKLQGILEAVTASIQQGQTLSEALGRFPRAFPPLYVNLVRSGEIAGTLSQVLDLLAIQADRDEALRSKLQSALAYPMFVLVVGIGTVVFLLTFVIPRLIGLFKGFGGSLPLPTRILLSVSAACQTPSTWIGVAGAGLLAIAVWRWQGAAIGNWLDRISLSLPLAGPLVRQLDLTRFARTYGLLLDQGIPILQATDVAVPVVRNRVIREALQRLPAHLKEGGTLSAGLTQVPLSSPFVVQAVAVGEESGKIGEALMEIANFYEREADRTLQMLSALMEPAMILAVGGVVGLIVFAVLLPIFEMSMIAK